MHTHLGAAVRVACGTGQASLTPWRLLFWSNGCKEQFILPVGSVPQRWTFQEVRGQLSPRKPRKRLGTAPPPKVLLGNLPSGAGELGWRRALPRTRSPSRPITLVLGRALVPQALPPVPGLQSQPHTSRPQSGGAKGPQWGGGGSGGCRNTKRPMPSTVHSANGRLREIPGRALSWLSHHERK